MSPLVILLIVACYFAGLIFVSTLTSKGADNEAFFTGSHKSPWYIVAFGMIGASLSGVTFISIPGWVGSSQFAYMQTVFGYMVGYLVIGTVLMPLYYRLQLTSIYTYLDHRFGFWTYKTGAFFFILSRTIGASFRLFLVANVLQFTIFNSLGVPFWITVIVTILLIWLYTAKGGIKTIIWTDTLQTVFMLGAVVITLYSISSSLGWSIEHMISEIKLSEHSRVFFFDDSNSSNYFWKHFIGGAFIAIAMTGLDQDMMQKNLSCRNIGEAQKNMLWFSISLIFVNLLFLSLGAMLYIFTDLSSISLPAKSDNLYPMLAMGGHLGPVVAVLFILGLIAAAYSSADSALTALTTSFCIDILDIRNKPKETQLRTRKYVHVGMSAVLFLCILIFRAINNESVIKELFTVAGYTYGPLLGMYSFGLFTNRDVRDKIIPVVCIVSPLICYLMSNYSQMIFNGYKFGFELLVVNGMLTFIGMWLFSSPQGKNKHTISAN